MALVLSVIFCAATASGQQPRTQPAHRMLNVGAAFPVVRHASQQMTHCRQVIYLTNDALAVTIVTGVTGTPYFLNLHNGEVAHTLILGMTGSGKSYLCSVLLQSTQKYAPVHLCLRHRRQLPVAHFIFGGSYLNVGRETRDFPHGYPAPEKP